MLKDDDFLLSRLPDVENNPNLRSISTKCDGEIESTKGNNTDCHTTFALTCAQGVYDCKTFALGKKTRCKQRSVRLLKSVHYFMIKRRSGLIQSTASN